MGQEKNKKNKKKKSAYKVAAREALDELALAQDEALTTLAHALGKLEEDTAARLDRLVATATDVVAKRVQAHGDLLAQLDEDVTRASDQANAACSAAAEDNARHLVAIRQTADERLAKLGELLTAAESQYRAAADVDYSELVDEVRGKAEEVTAHLLATRQAADTHLDELAEQSARHAHELRTAFDEHLNELRVVLTRKTDESLKPLEVRVSAVVEATLHHTSALIEQIESTAAATRTTREEVNQIAEAVAAVARHATSCAADVDAVLSEIHHYANTVGDVVGQAEDEANDVRELVDSLLPDLEADLAYLASASTTADELPAIAWSTPADPVGELLPETPVAADADSIDVGSAEPEEPAPSPLAPEEPPSDDATSVDEPDDHFSRPLDGGSPDADPFPDGGTGAFDTPVAGDPLWAALGDGHAAAPTHVPQSVGVLEWSPEPVAPLAAPASESTTASTVTVRVASVEACIHLLTRGAAECPLRMELVPALRDGEPVTCLRLTAFDPEGWWEYHDVVVTADAVDTQPAIVSVHELKEALADARRFGATSTTQLLLDGDVAIGNHLLLSGASDDAPPLAADRTPVERIELRSTDGVGLVLETQSGRLFLRPELLGCLRRRRASTFDLVTIDGLPHLSAEIAGAPDSVATIVAPLQQLGDDDEPIVTDRRSTQGSEVAQLVSALSAATPPEELSRILKIGVGYVRRRAAAHPALSKELIYDLVKDGTEAMRAAAAANPSIGTRACASSQPPMRRRSSEPASPRMLRSRRPSWSDSLPTRWHTSEPARRGTRRVLRRSSRSSRRTPIRRCVVRSPPTRTSPSTSSSSSRATRTWKSVRRSRSTPCARKKCSTISSGSSPTRCLPIRARRRRCSSRVASSTSPACGRRSRRNPATPPKRLRKLARDDDADVLAGVADHPQAPKSARRRARQRLDQGDDDTSSAFWGSS